MFYEKIAVWSFDCVDKHDLLDASSAFVHEVNQKSFEVLACVYHIVSRDSSPFLVPVATLSKAAS